MLIGDGIINENQKLLVVTQLINQISGTSVRFLTPVAMVCVQIRMRSDFFMACLKDLFSVWVLCLWNSVLEVLPVIIG